MSEKNATKLMPFVGLATRSRRPQEIKTSSVLTRIPEILSRIEAHRLARVVLRCQLLCSFQRQVIMTGSQDSEHNAYGTIFDHSLHRICRVDGEGCPGSSVQSAGRRSHRFGQCSGA